MRSAALTTSVHAAMDEVAAATADLPKPRVFYELDNSSGYFGPAPDYFGTEMIETAGGDPLTSGTDGVYQIQEEQILDFDPEVILLDEPCSALDPIATAKVEELMQNLKDEYTQVVVTHNMQQASRVSDYTAFLYLGQLVEFGETEQIFIKPEKQQTEDYITGRFG